MKGCTVDDTTRIIEYLELIDDRLEAMRDRLKKLETHVLELLNVQHHLIDKINVAFGSPDDHR